MEVETQNNSEEEGNEAETGTKPGTFTSEQQTAIDHLVGKARTSGRDTAVKALLEELGVDSAEAAKAAIDAADKLKREQLTELEKAQADVETHKAAADTAKADADKVVAKARLTLMRSAVMLEAAKPEYKVDAAALTDIWSFVLAESLDKLDIDDSDTVTGTDDAIKAVLEKREYITNDNTPHVYGTPRASSRKSKEKTTDN